MQATDGLFRKFGDGDGNGRVNIMDFLNFRGTFGSEVGDANFDDAFDFDDNGSVSIVDFIAFRGRFGT